MKLVDTHCHIYGESYKEDLDEVLARAGEDLEFIVNIGYDLNSSQIAVELANKYPFAYATVGVHPTDISGYSEEVEEKLLELVKNKKVVAIGEIGLDYYWMKDPKEVQAIYFRKQMDLARKLNLPVVIHTRDAAKETFDILKGVGKEYNLRGVLHCYTGSVEMALEYIELGFYISLGGPVTFKNSRVSKEVAIAIPLDKLLIETDSPYLTPEPYRGKRNEPQYVKYTAKTIAELRGISVEELARATSDNAKRIFQITGKR